MNFRVRNVFSKTTKKRVLEAVEFDKKLLKGIEDNIKNVKGRRDEFYAHLSKDILGDTQKAFRDNPLNVEQIQSMYTLIGEILNRYSVFIDGSTTMMEIMDTEDVGKLLKYVGVKLRENKEEHLRGFKNKTQVNSVDF